MDVREFIESAAGVVNASMNPLKVVTQKHLRLAMIRDVREVDRQKAPPVAQDHRVVVATHHPDDVIAHVNVVRFLRLFFYIKFSCNIIQKLNFFSTNYFSPLYTP
jgi:hypothetical protein